METLLSIIIPAYNEEDRIIPTLTHTVDYLKQQPFLSEVVVVSDGSRDQTMAVVSRFKSTDHVKVKALEYHPNRGKGYAVAYGMVRGEGRVVMFMDADYAVPISYCEEGLNLLHKKHDIAIASRALAGAQITSRQNLLRRLSAKFYTLIQNQYLGLHFPDTQCGFKLFTQKAAKDLFARQQLTSVIFDPEILWLGQKLGYSIAQFPVQWTHVADSRIQYDNLRKSLFVFQELLRIKGLHPDIR
ncbi:MAG: glycosyltransferase family 2 protein [Desulfobacteraceae bacterium]|nr:glycosyltransferase family 2 protein [Desulfobacteraceae bacterium]